MTALSARPNILWIYCDQLRTDALGCYGNRWMRPVTPHVDRLAAQGVLFEHAFVNSPVCVSSRAAVHTGLAPEQTGVYHNEAVVLGDLVPPARTFPEVLAAAGYATADFGKEHIPLSWRPWQHRDPSGASALTLMAGLDGDAMRLVRWPAGGVLAGRWPADRPFPPATLVDGALDWLARATEPFLVRASFLQPHTPVVAPEPFASLYDDVAFPDRPVEHPGISAFERRLGEVARGAELGPEEFVRAQADYYALVAWLDAEIGRLFDGLAALGLDDRTVVVFTADHGAHLGEHGAYGKQTFAPQAQRVPLIVRAPGLAGGERRDDLVQGLDLARTFCGLAEVDADPGFGGRDLFSGSPAPDRVFGTIGYGAVRSRAYPAKARHSGDSGTYLGGRGWPRRSCVRTDRWRLDRNVRIDGSAAVPADWDVFLADRRTDPEEVVNLAGRPEHAGVVTGLLEALAAHVADSVEFPDELVYPDTTSPAA